MQETTAEEGVHLLLAELPPEWEPYLYHLLTCEPCRAWAARRLTASAELATDLYGPAFERLLARTGETVAEGRRRRGAAEALLAELLALDPRARGLAVAAPHFCDRDLVELLLDRSAEAQLEDPARAEELAGLAVELGTRLKDGSDAGFQALFRGHCLAGNARRLLDRRGESEAAYLLASFWLTGRADRAALCRGLALLRREQGLVEEAAALLALLRLLAAPELALSGARRRAPAFRLKKGREKMIDLEAARERLGAVAGELGGIRSRLLELAAGLPVSPAETSEDDLDIEPPPSAELRALIGCGVQDRLDPLIRYLSTAAERARR